LEDLKEAYGGWMFLQGMGSFRVRHGVKILLLVIGGQNNPTYGIIPDVLKGQRVLMILMRLPYKELLDYFFRVHDPTTIDQRGNDIGEQFPLSYFIQNEQEAMHWE